MGVGALFFLCQEARYAVWGALGEPAAVVAVGTLVGRPLLARCALDAPVPPWCWIAG